jgi:hypothetical protein
VSTQGQTIEEANDWMALEPRLVELARAAVAGLKPAVHVLTHADLAAVAETAQQTPAIHVIYGGYRIAEDQATAWRLAHTWYVVAAVRNVAAISSGQPARLSAGSLLARVTGCLVAQKLEGATKPLALVSPPAAQYRAGFQYIPSAFEVETIFRKPL